MTPRLFVAEDGWSDLCVWEHLPARPDYPQVVLSLRDVKDAGLRKAIVALVESGAVA